MKLPKQDQVIYCPACDHDLFRFKRDVEHGDVPSNELLELVGEQPFPKLGDLVECVYCHSPVVIHNVRWPGDVHETS